MNRSSPVSFAPLAALLLAGSALAQTIPAPNPSGVDADRVNRRCTSTTLSVDASAPCPDDVLNDRQGVSPVVVRPQGGSTAGSGNTGAGSTGTSIGTTGTPTLGTVNPGTASIPGAAGTGAAPASGAAPTPARR